MIMREFYERQAIVIVKQMIQAFYVEKDVDKVLSFTNPEKFTWIGSGESLVLTDFDEIRNFFKSKCGVITENYKIVDEDYFISASSADSCVVFAKISFRGTGARENYFPKLHFSFYLQIIDGELLVSHYHVHQPIKNVQIQAAQSMLAMDNFIGPVDLAYTNEILYNFFNATGIALKCFFYENDFPYCCVNKAFLNLVGLKKISDITNKNMLSSLAHIHPNDQQNYISRLENCFADKPRNLDLSSEWQWQASYYLFYRMQTFDNAEKIVFEWGNLFTLNSRPIVNGFVLPMDNIKDISPPPRFLETGILPFWVKSSGEGLLHEQNISALLNDFGVHIGNDIIIYPKSHKVSIKDKPLDLTTIEFKLMLALVESVNVPISSETLYKNLWQEGELKDTSSSLKMHVSNLRRKIKSISGDEITISHVKNKGYCLTIPKF